MKHTTLRPVNPVGKVKTEMVKRVAIELVMKYPRSFGTEFENNKKFLQSLNVGVTKKIRNKVAGYATRLIRSQLNYETGLGEVEPDLQ
jgi:small subunit ribosomal protein S17e